MPNFHTKVNLVEGLINDTDTYKKVLIFVAYKRMADKLFELLDERFYGQCCVIHANKTQNYRLRSIEQFEEGTHRILIATDVMARGLDITNISHVINFDTPEYPENYCIVLVEQVEQNNWDMPYYFLLPRNKTTKMLLKL